MQPTDQSLESVVVRNRQEAIVVSAELQLSCAELADGCGAAVCLWGTKPRSGKPYDVSDGLLSASGFLQESQETGFGDA